MAHVALEEALTGRRGLRNHFVEQDSPADQGVAAIADTGLDRQVEIAGLVDEAADFAGRLVMSTSSACRRR
jgi:hypothetical protein